MTAETHTIRPTDDRSLIWWLSIILAPIGLFGGPIEIANMVSGVVEWHGPIGYLVNFWSENVSVHFANVFGLITGFFHIRPLSDLVVSYLTLGILLITSILRAATLLNVKISPLMFFVALLPGIFMWPAAVWSAVPAFMSKKSRGPAALIMAPFFIFIVLWAVNALFA